MRKKKMAVYITTIFLSMFSISSYAAERSVTNHLQMGAVDIQVEEFQIVNGVEVPWKDQTGVLPGQIISKIPRITNQGSDCYIRTKVCYQDVGLDVEDTVYGWKENWIRKEDGYYYYTDIVKEREYIDLFEGIQIPADLSQTMQEKSFQLEITVDAIQSRHVSPDFLSDYPWGDVEIVKSEERHGYSLQAVQARINRLLEITYEGESKELFINEEDFFVNIPVLLPGDRYTDCIEIKNIKEKELSLYFRSEVIEEKELLKQVQLEIVAEAGDIKKTLYEGELSGKELNSNRLLLQIPQASQGKMYFTLSIPKELGNAFETEKAVVKWIFSTVEKEEPKKPESPETPEKKRPPSVKTGDEANILWPICGLICGFAGVYGIGMRKKR